jgi:hypothetical protein
LPALWKWRCDVQRFSFGGIEIEDCRRSRR